MNTLPFYLVWKGLKGRCHSIHGVHGLGGGTGGWIGGWESANFLSQSVCVSPYFHPPGSGLKLFHGIS